MNSPFFLSASFSFFRSFVLSSFIYILMWTRLEKKKHSSTHSDNERHHITLHCIASGKMDQIFDTETVGAPTYTALGPGLSWKEKDRGEGEGEESPIPVRVLDSRRGSSYESPQRTFELNRNNNNNNNNNNYNNRISSNEDECDDPFVYRSTFERNELAGVNKNLSSEYINSSSSSSLGFTSTVNPLTESLNVNVYVDDENEENDDKENDDDVKSDHYIDDINLDIR
jgi:hypothetical protein